MSALEARKKDLDALNSIAVGISVDSTHSKKAWAENIGIKETRLLADFWPHGGVAKLYGVFREQDGLAHRSIFIVDEKGKIVFSKVYQMAEMPDMDEINDVLKKMAAGTRGS